MRRRDDGDGAGSRPLADIEQERGADIEPPAHEVGSHLRRAGKADQHHGEQRDGDIPHIVGNRGGQKDQRDQKQRNRHRQELDWYIREPRAVDESGDGGIGKHMARSRSGSGKEPSSRRNKQHQDEERQPQIERHDESVGLPS